MVYYTVTFNTNLGTKRSIRINEPAAGLAEADIQAAVAQIISNDVFDPKKGALAAFNKMESVSLERSVVLQ